VGGPAGVGRAGVERDGPGHRRRARVVPAHPAGKVDRSALPPPKRGARPYRAPDGPEYELASIFSDVLGVDRVGLDDDFFELGGDSLGVVELVAAIAERFGIDIPASLVLDAPTPEVSSTVVRDRLRRGEPIAGLVPRLVETHILQHRLYVTSVEAKAAGSANELHGQN